MGDLREALKELLGEMPDQLFIATVESVDEITFSCNVVQEKEEIPIENVPLRVMRLNDELGFTVVPKVGTFVVVGLINGRPTILKVQEWDRIYLEKESGFWLEVDVADNVTVRTEGDAEVTATNIYSITQSGHSIELLDNGVANIKADEVNIGGKKDHKAAWGDAWLPEFNKHIHPTPTGPSGPPNPSLVDTQVNSQKVTVD